MSKNEDKDNLCVLIKEGVEKLGKNGSTIIQIITGKGRDAQLTQLPSTDYISEESRLRAEEALRFYEYIKNDWLLLSQRL